uniref:Uncharacterized protein n=1 Tax=Glossina austeni TaxID=7395 RepID=A0A1A9UQX3_GLOAU
MLSANLAHKGIATATRAAIILGKFAMLLVQRSHWSNISHLAALAAPVLKRLFTIDGIEDCCTSVHGSTRALGKFEEGTYAVLAKTDAYLTSGLWKEVSLVSTLT